MLSTEYIFVVEVRSHTAPTTIGTLGFEVAGLEVHSLEFLVDIDRAALPEQPDVEQQIEAYIRAAAERVVERMALAGWAAGKYLLTVRARYSATHFTATIDDQREHMLHLGW